MKNLYLSFSAGRRGAGSIDCLLCGAPIHQRPQPGLPDADAPWFDGHGDNEAVIHDNKGYLAHKHQPAKEDGPTLGPFEHDYVAITYNTVRYEGETIAFWDQDRGDWIIADGYEGADEAYSDITIFLKESA